MENEIKSEQSSEKTLPEIKLIAIDIDGTLLTPDGRISARTRAAIQAAQRAGIIVTLATARRYGGAQEIASALGMELPLIVYDGALIVSHPARTILARQTLAPVLASQAIDLLCRYHIQPIVHPCESEQCVKEEVWTGPEEFDNAGVLTYLRVADKRVRRMSYEQMTEQATAILRVVAFAEEELLQTLLPTVSTLACCWNFAPIGGYQSAEISILEAGCSKASGVSTLAAHCGIAPEHVMAIGDSYNDLEMIRIAGWGVAMGQAPEPVKAIANAITATNQADGVALAIERYALGQANQVEAVAPVDMVESAALLTSFNILP